MRKIFQIFFNNSILQYFKSANNLTELNTRVKGRSLTPKMRRHYVPLAFLGTPLLRGSGAAPLTGFMA